MRHLSILALGAAALLTTPVLAQGAPATAPAAGAAAAAPNVTAGATVSDASGGAVGTIDAIANGVATLNTGTVKAGVPVSSFAQGPNGLVIGLTKAQIDAQAAQAAAPQFTVGATVVGPQGKQVGTVKEVGDTTVTVASGTVTAQLPKASFAQGPNGLTIGLTPEQFEAAAKAAGGKTG